jgi:hypothetical protein
MLNLGSRQDQFEAKMVLREMEEPILQKSIQEARRAGYLKNRKLRVAPGYDFDLGQGSGEGHLQSARTQMASHVQLRSQLVAVSAGACCPVANVTRTTTVPAIAEKTTRIPVNGTLPALRV